MPNHSLPSSVSRSDLAAANARLLRERGPVRSTHPTIKPVSETLRLAAQAYNQAHARYMRTSVYTPEGKLAKIDVDYARLVYTQAIRDEHPDWIVM